MRVAVAGTVAALLVAGGCQMNERMSGTAIGGVSGAVLGAATAGGVGGVVVGGAVGALAGYLIGDYLADQRERCCCAPQQQQQPCPQCQPCQPTCSPCAVSGSATDAGAPARQQAYAAYLRGKQARTAPEARAAYEEAVRLDPTLPDAWNGLGLNAWYAGDRENAERCFSEAVRVDPTYDPGLRNLEFARSATAPAPHGA
jgi:hypothetical protein